MKKGQLEMMGLMIIVIILVIGALFYVKFALVSKDEKKQDVVTSVQAFNLMNAVLNVYICGNTSLRSAIVSCDLNEGICGEECDFKGDYKVFEDKIDDIVKEVTYLEYSFYVNKGEIEVFKIEGCEFGVTSPAYPISERNQYYTTYFRVCRK